jgi:hypothetical protein
MGPPWACSPSLMATSLSGDYLYVFRCPYENPFHYMTVCMYVPYIVELSSSQSLSLFTKQKLKHYLITAFGLLWRITSHKREPWFLWSSVYKILFSPQSWLSWISVQWRTCFIKGVFRFLFVISVFQIRVAWNSA